MYMLYLHIYPPFLSLSFSMEATKDPLEFLKTKLEIKKVFDHIHFEADENSPGCSHNGIKIYDGFIRKTNQSEQCLLNILVGCTDGVGEVLAQINFFWFTSRSPH